MERRKDYVNLGAEIAQMRGAMEQHFGHSKEFRADVRNRLDDIELKLKDVASKPDLEEHRKRIARIESVVTWVGGVAAAVTVFFSDIGKKIISVLS